MSIWLPIIVNILIAGILIAGFFVGKKNGFVYEIVKLFTMCAFGVGIYFLSPIITSALCQIEFISNLVLYNLITLPILNSIVIVLLFTIIYGLVSLIFKLIKRSGNKKFGINKAKRIKIKGINREETRRLRKEQRHLDKTQRREARKLTISKASKVSKAFGIIFGILNAIIIAFVITLPLKPIFRHIADNQPAIEEIVKGYEYTPYGQLDNVTDIVDKIIGE